MEYTVYIGNGCHDCALVVKLLKKKNISFRVVHVDKGDEKPPFDLFIYPALFKEGALIAYGIDILDHFSISYTYKEPWWSPFVAFAMKLMPAKKSS